MVHLAELSAECDLDSITPDTDARDTRRIGHAGGMEHSREGKPRDAMEVGRFQSVAAVAAWELW